MLQSAPGGSGGAAAPLTLLVYRRRRFGWREDSPAAATAKHNRRRLAASRAAERALDAALVQGRVPPPTADVLVVGAGLAGLIVASRFAQAGARVVMLERSNHVGGVWRQHANPFSRVNSSEPGYRVPVRRATPNTNHSHHSEILVDALRLLRGEVEAPTDGTRDDATSLADKIFLGCEVRGVQEVPAGQQQLSPSRGWRVVGVCGAEAVPFEVRSGTVVVCTNRRLGVPRSLTLKGEADFLGAVRRGLAGDCEDVHWRGQRVVILGMGAFALESMRTAFQGGAAHVTLLCRRRGTVCPQSIDWLNFIRPWGVHNHLPRHDAAGTAKVLQAWRAAYDVSGAVQPECWQQACSKVLIEPCGVSRMHTSCMLRTIPHHMHTARIRLQGMLRPDGHTISVSDLFFIAHHLGMMVSATD